MLTPTYRQRRPAETGSRQKLEWLLPTQLHLVLSHTLKQEVGLGTHPSIQEIEAGGLFKFMASLRYTVKPCLKNKGNRKSPMLRVIFLFKDSWSTQESRV